MERGAEWWMARFDIDRSGFLERGEFLNAMLTYIAAKVGEPSEASVVEAVADYAGEGGGGGGGEEAEEEHELL